MSKLDKDYTSLKKKEMQDTLKKRGVAFKRNANRDDLIALLVGSEVQSVSLLPSVLILVAVTVLILSVVLLLQKVV